MSPSLYRSQYAHISTTNNSSELKVVREFIWQKQIEHDTQEVIIYMARDFCVDKSGMQRCQQKDWLHS